MLVAQVGRQVALGVAGPDEGGELVAPGFGTQVGQGALVVGPEDPPRGLALGAVLADQDADALAVEATGALAEDEAGHRALGFVFFGGVSMSSRPAWDRWRTMRFPSSKCQTRYLARRVTAVRVAPLRSAGEGA